MTSVDQTTESVGQLPSQTTTESVGQLLSLWDKY